MVNDYEGLRDNPQLEVTTLATISEMSLLVALTIKGQASLIKVAFLTSLFCSCIRLCEPLPSLMK